MKLNVYPGLPKTNRVALDSGPSAIASPKRLWFQRLGLNLRSESTKTKGGQGLERYVHIQLDLIQMQSMYEKL